MKNHILPIIITAALLASCSGEKKEGLTGKKEELTKLKTEQSETEKKIKALESEIAKLDTTKRAETNIKIVTVQPLAAGTLSHYVELQGSVDAKNSVMVTPKSGGAVTAVYVREGDQVKTGTVLARVDDSILRESIEEVKSQLTLANTIFTKQKNLWDQKIGTEIQFLQAQNNKEGLEKKLATLNAQLSQSRITAPISGVVDQVNVKVGETAMPGAGVFRVVNLGNLKVIAKVSDTYAASVKRGDEILISFPDLQKDYKAKVSFVSTTVDPLSRTFTIEANLPSSPVLKPNMVAKVQINDATKKNALIVDQNIIQGTEKGQVVYVAVNENGKKMAKSKLVKTGLIYNGKIEVTEGLQAGDEIITTGYQEVSDGQTISY
jgi:membrane fusion protein (multidrug efflux system)